MNEKHHKIDKEFVLSDSSKNVYGFKLLTSGYQPQEFKKLPIGFFNHKNKEDGALVRWEDIRLDGDMIKAKPVINMSHPRGQRTVDEINGGFISAASLSGLVILETKTEPDPDDPSKKIPVVTKWYNKECDLVTLPGNRNALAVPQLYDADDNEIQLSDLLNSHENSKTIIMEQNIPKEILQALQLNDSANAAAALLAITELSDKAKRTDKAEADLAKLKQEISEKELTDLLDAAVTAGKITVELSGDLKKDYAGKPDALKKLLDGMRGAQSIVGQLRTDKDKNSALYKELSDKTYDVLDQENKLELCLADYPQLFKEKYIAAFGEKAWSESTYAKQIA